MNAYDLATAIAEYLTLWSSPHVTAEVTTKPGENISGLIETQDGERFVFTVEPAVQREEAK
jgi:hypothetical protein